MTTNRIPGSAPQQHSQGKPMKLLKTMAFAIALMTLQSCKPDLSKVPDRELDLKTQEPEYAQEMQKRILDALNKDDFKIAKDVIERFPKTAFDRKIAVISSPEGQSRLLGIAKSAIQNGCLPDDRAVERFSRLALLSKADAMGKPNPTMEQYYALAQGIQCKLNHYSPFLAKYYEQGKAAGKIPTQTAELQLNSLFVANDLEMAKDGPVEYMKKRLSNITKFKVSKGKDRNIQYDINLDVYSSPTLDDGMAVALHSILNPIGYGPLNLYREAKSIRANVYMSGAGTHYKLASVVINRGSLEKIYGNPDGPEGDRMDLDAWNAPWQGLQGMSWISWCKRKGLMCTYASLRS